MTQIDSFNDSAAMRCKPSSSALNSSVKRNRFAGQRGMLAAASFFLAAELASAQPTASDDRPVISPAQQQVRDTDRIAVLRQELKKTEDLVAALSRKKAEHAANPAAPGSDELQAQHERAMGDLAALKRELANATRDAAPSATQPAAVTVKAVQPRAAARTPASESPPPWWDVYSRQRSSAPEQPVSQAPAAAGALQPGSGRPMEQ